MNVLKKFFFAPPAPVFQQLNAQQQDYLSLYFPESYRRTPILTKHNLKHFPLNSPYILDWDMSERSQNLIDPKEKNLLQGAVAVLCHSKTKKNLLMPFHPVVIETTNLQNVSPIKPKPLSVFINHFRDEVDLLKTLESLESMKTLFQLKCHIVSWHSKPNLPSGSLGINWEHSPLRDYCGFFDFVWNRLAATCKNSSSVLYLESGCEITPKAAVALYKNSASHILGSAWSKTNLVFEPQKVSTRTFYFQPSMIPCVFFNNFDGTLDTNCGELALWEHALSQKAPLPCADYPFLYNHETLYRHPVYYYQKKLMASGIDSSEIPDHFENSLAVRHTHYTYIIEKHLAYFQKNLPSFLGSLDTEFQQINAKKLLMQKKIKV